MTTATTFGRAALAAGLFLAPLLCGCDNASNPPAGTTSTAPGPGTTRPADTGGGMGTGKAAPGNNTGGTGTGGMGTSSPSNP